MRAQRASIDSRVVRRRRVTALFASTRLRELDARRVNPTTLPCMVLFRVPFHLQSWCHFLSTTSSLPYGLPLYARPQSTQCRDVATSNAQTTRREFARLQQHTNKRDRPTNARTDRPTDNKQHTVAARATTTGRCSRGGGTNNKGVCAQEGRDGGSGGSVGVGGGGRKSHCQPHSLTHAVDLRF